MLQQLEHKPFRQNPHFERYVDLLIRLHDAMRDGDEDEAERLRRADGRAWTLPKQR